MDGWNTTFLSGRPIFRGYVLVSEKVDVSLNAMGQKDPEMPGLRASNMYTVSRPVIWGHDKKVSLANAKSAIEEAVPWPKNQFVWLKWFEPTK